MDIIQGSWLTGFERNSYFAIWYTGSNEQVPQPDQVQEVSIFERLQEAIETITVDTDVQFKTMLSAGGKTVLLLRPMEGRHFRFLTFLLQLPSAIDGMFDRLTIHGSLRYWANAAEIVLDLLASQHFIPSVHTSTRTASGSTTKVYHGMWDPLLEDPILGRKIQNLIDNMPVTNDTFLYIQTVPEEIRLQSVTEKERLQHFIRMFIDNSIRECLDEEDHTAVMKQLNPRYVSPLRPTEHWIFSLFHSSSGNGVPPLEWLEDEIGEWRTRLIGEQTRASIRTCFRLVAPEYVKEKLEKPQIVSDIDDDHSVEAAWKLEFYLQAVDDPSIMMSARQIWIHDAEQILHLNQRLEHPQERLLSDLANAAERFQPISCSLESAFPCECELNTSQAYEFLTHAATELENSGFGIYVPSWWTPKKRQPGIALRLKENPSEQQENRTFAGKMFSFDKLFHYEWKLSLEDEILSREEYEQLAALKLPLVRWKDKWFEFSPKSVKEAMSLFQQGTTGLISFADAVHLSLIAQSGESDSALSIMPNSEQHIPLPIRRISAEGAIQAFLTNLWLEDNAPLLEQPSALRGQLRGYQLKGFSWMVRMRRLSLGACLADDMGLGKTIQWIAYLLYLKQEHLLLGPSLLICPTSVIGNWQRELEKFAPSLKVMVHYGPNRLSGESLAKQSAQYDIVLTSYGIVNRDEADLSAIVWDVVTLDEAQNIKNSSTKQSQSIRKLQANHRIALTGTPVENRLAELWSVFDFLNADYLGTKQQFATRFAAPIERNEDRQMAAVLHQIVKPFIKRRVKSDESVIQDLPEKQEMKVYCSLTREQATLYEAYVQNALQKVERAKGMERRGIILAALTHLKQICNHPAHFLRSTRHLEGRSGKLARLHDMLEEVIGQGERALVFTQYAKMAELLKKYLEEHFSQQVFLLHGSVTKKKRDEMIAAFQEKPDAPSIFILSLKTGGFGINLTRANHVFHYDRWWNPAVENQATDRAYRIGQRKNVQVHKLICSGTLEERIDELSENKLTLAESVVGSGEEWLTEMSTEDLKHIFALRREMLVETD